MLRLYFDVPTSPYNMYGFIYVVYDTKNNKCIGLEDFEDVLSAITEKVCKWDWFNPANYDNLQFVEISSKEELALLHPELFI